ncbi:peptidase S41 family protein-like protein [Cucurbitaria berberidis CBS 394.84]|uniref:Peptidase S41 family protein-like protein n=1 Tax=Cucurbitaria berberidis CBS 394.84 TaxID=1168544 RepID=A0A9P4GN69_9PLEO|nr:peptidase S41 family protein-like protein [Cucurbitaria berberidis CBS 394.84]KAF1848095.1 peptidase S41 family protein-like protein [Cucurbitaria berberidis CBS 394.84]
MKTFTALSALIAVASAQGISSRFGRTTQSLDVKPTSIGDVEPTATETVSGPIQTERACAAIADSVSDTVLKLPAVDAELAYACLKTVPIIAKDASSTIDSIKQMVEFQSTLSYLKDPPKGYPNGAVDIMAGLEDIKSRVNKGDYTNEYDFENDIASLLVKAHDGHLNFQGMAYAGAFRWRRSSSIALISASKDGSEEPKVWAIADFNTTDTSYTRSPITQINGKDVAQFLQDEANLIAYHDPDTRYNAMFFLQSAENFGYFTNPRFYPGPTTSVTYENGTSDEYKNVAVVVQPRAWQDITDPKSFYETYIIPQASSRKIKKRDPNDLPMHLENPRDHEFRSYSPIQQGSVPLLYPKPVVAHSAPKVPLAGYFLSTSVGQIGVLVVQTFNTNKTAEAVEFQAVVQNYIAQAKSRGVEKHIIDVRANGGGKVLSGYDMYLQFFPSQEPQTQSRYRGHRASELFGKSISSFLKLTSLNAELFTSPFSNDGYVNSKLEKFNSWADMYPPETFHNDRFTSLLKYNLSDPLMTSNPRLGLGITVTGYNDRSNFTADPFRAEDIIILSDGLCASTCALFLELMVQQSHVKTLAVGGRPHSGPMTPVGGTKGTLVLPSTYLQSLSAYTIQNFASSRSEARDWASFVPNPFPIAVADASVNFQDNIRAGMEKGGMPTQFLNDSASCRIWYQPDMLLNVTKLWERAAVVAFGGKDGGLNEQSCVSGSVASREMQVGKGEGNPSSGGNGTADKKDAAAGLRPGWAAVGVWAVVVGVSFLVL